MASSSESETAKKLVWWSHLLGWGGLGLVFAIGPALGIALSSIKIGGLTAAGGLISAVVGAIIGQVGRGMQGRVI